MKKQRPFFKHFENLCSQLSRSQQQKTASHWNKESSSFWFLLICCWRELDKIREQ